MNDFVAGIICIFLVIILIIMSAIGQYSQTQKVIEKNNICVTDIGVVVYDINNTPICIKRDAIL